MMTLLLRGAGVVGLFCLLGAGIASCSSSSGGAGMARQEYGNTFEGSNSVNWGGGRFAGAKLDLSFIPASSKTLDAIWICWRTSEKYGGGDFGTWDFTLYRDDPNGHIPSASVISALTGVRGLPNDYLKLDLPDVAVQAGSIYHLVMRNTDADLATNWSSPNLIRARSQFPACGDRVLESLGQAWEPMVAGDDDGQITRFNGAARAAYLVQYTDGSSEGMPYHSALTRPLTKGAVYGEHIPWTQADTVITRVGFSVVRYGMPTGPLTFTLEEVNGAVLATGAVASPQAMTESPEWYYTTLAPPVTLRRGANYRLYLRADSEDQTNCYVIFIPYTSGGVPDWPALTWGGTKGQLTYFEDNRWQFDGQVPYDLTFSLSGEG